MLSDAFSLVCSCAQAEPLLAEENSVIYFEALGPGNLPSNLNPVAHKLQTSGDVQPSCCCVTAFSRGVGASSSGCICLLCIQEALSSTASGSPEGRWSWRISHLRASNKNNLVFSLWSVNVIDMVFHFLWKRNPSWVYHRLL